jgi:Zn-dependent protease with chaperone function
MNFFENQDLARRKTRQLLLLFAASVLTLIVGIYCVTIVTFGKSLGAECVATSAPNSTNYSSSSSSSNRRYRSRNSRNSPGCTINTWVQPKVFFTVAGVTVALILGASGYKIQQLKQGGHVIAEQLGGRRIMSDTHDAAERMLLNVVEEMAIAAGISVPEVYLLDNEHGINAFAAGYTPNDAVIGVTRGSLEVFNRDELQGVIGHEFSHILNGDMRMNINLMGWLHGILCIYLIGRGICDITYYDRDRGKGVGYFGFGLIVLGGSGLFFGRLMQSAISRQREFLADASAVQFTRNPDGIASALEKIGGHGSKLQASYAQASSHMFFGSVLSSMWSFDWFATHPPIEKRVMKIRGLQPGDLAASSLYSSQQTDSSPTSSSTSSFSSSLNSSFSSSLNSSIGTVNPGHYDYAKGLLAQIPDDLRSSLRSPQTACCIVYALLLDRENQLTYDQQIEYLKKVLSADDVAQTIAFGQQIKDLNDRLYLPMLDLAVPALRQKMPQDCTRVLVAVHELAKIDGKWTLAEFVSYLVLHYRLTPHIKGPFPPSSEHPTIGPVWGHSLNLIAALARVGHRTQDQIDYAFRSGFSYLPGAAKQDRPQTVPPLNLLELRQGLEQIRMVSPRVKQGVVDACVHTVMLDNQVTSQEADLLRAIVILLDCPIPPFLEKPIAQPVKTV